MMKFLFGLRGNTEIIDVTKTAEKLEEAAEFLRGQAASGKTIMLVGTRPSLAELTKTAAQELNAPYVTVRWIGGTLTNFAVIGKRLDTFRNLVEQEQTGELKEKYTKAERVRFQRKIAKLTEELGGIKNMTDLPDVLVITSLRANKLAAVEARKKGISTVAVVDTDADPRLVDFPIPANDDSLPSVALIVERLKEAIEEGKGKHKEKKAKAAKEAEAKKQAEEKAAKKKKAKKTEKKTEKKEKTPAK